MYGAENNHRMNRDGDGRFSKDKHLEAAATGRRSTNQIETKTKHGGAV